MRPCVRFTLPATFAALALHAAPARAVTIFSTDSGTGRLVELSATDGSLVSSSIGGGLVNATGITFGPSGGARALYVAQDNAGAVNDRIVRVASDRTTVTQVVSFGSSTFNPYDMTFDASGNMYVVGETDVRKYDSSGNQLFSFAHGMSNIRSYVGQKPFSILVHPTTGQILVSGHSPSNGTVRVFDSDGSGTVAATLPEHALSLGGSAMTFAPNGAAGAFLYVGEPDGNDRIAVYDVNLNFLRLIDFYALTLTDEIIGLDVDPDTGEIYSMGALDGGSGTGAKINQDETLAFRFAYVQSGRDIAVGSFTEGAAVPEPTTALLAALGIAAVAGRRRRSS